MQPRIIGSVQVRYAVPVIIALLTTVSTPFGTCLPVPSRTPMVWAQSQDPRTQAEQLFQQGVKHYQASQLEAAIASWQQSLTLYRQLQDRQGEGITLMNLGATYLSLENYNQAINFLQLFLPIAQATGNHRGEGQALGNLGIAYKELGNYVKAIECHQQALAIMQTLRDRQGEGQVLGNLGNAYEALGKYDKAIKFYQQSLTIVRAINDRNGEGAALGNIGYVEANRGNYDRAVELYQQSLAIKQAIGDRVGQAHTLLNLGVAYHVRGNLDRAIDYYTQSLTIAQALHYRRLEADALGSLGLAYENLRKYDRAIQYYERSLKLAQEIREPQLHALSLRNLAHALFTSGKLIEAEKKLRTAVDVLEPLRPGLDDYNVSIFDTQVLTYNLLQQVLLAQKRPEAALEIAERGRARAFVQLLTKRLSGQAVAQSSLNSKPIQIQQIQQIARQQKATLVEYSIVPEETPLQGKLRGRASEILIWVVQPTGEVAFQQVSLESLWQQQKISLADLVARSRESLGVRGRGIGVVARNNVAANEKRSQQLHQLLIQPITHLLPKDPTARVIFIAQESLFLVPFAALQAADGKYLVEQHTILTAPAIQVLDLTHKQQQHLGATRGVSSARTATLVVGNPTMPKVIVEPGQPPEQLPPLPGAEREAKAIASLLQTKAITGNQATKIEIIQQLPKARLIHLATHGLLDDIQQSGVPGAIALAPSPTDSGLLTASEIMSLKLSAELVVLSACDTGQGEITGDGVIGLSRSLISAGTPSAIVSLWSVPDAPTAFLMTEFYRQLQHHPDKAQALRVAMLKTKAQNPNPKDWAAFTLIGEAE